MRLLDKVLYGFIVAAILASIIVAFMRVSIEGQNNHLEIVMDLSALSELALRQGMTEEELVSKFREAGISGLAISEDNLESLRLKGVLNWYTGADLERALKIGLEKLPDGLEASKLSPINRTKLYIAIYDPQILEQLNLFLPLFLGKEKVRIWTAVERISGDAPAFIEVPGEEEEIASMGVGFSLETVAKYRDAGLSIILRPESKKIATGEIIDEYTRILMDYRPIHSIIFTGVDNDVLGYPDNLDSAAGMIKRLGCCVGNIEAPNVKAMQKGIQTISGKCADSTLRVQSLPVPLQDKLTVGDAVDKFDLGARERNIRMFYLRPFLRPLKDNNLVDSNVYYVSLLKNVLGSHGFLVGKTKPLPLFRPPAMLVILMGLGAISAFLLLLRKTFALSDSKSVALLTVWTVVLILFLLADKMPLFRKLSALGGALVFPVLAFVLNFEAIKACLKKRTLPALIGGASVVLIRVTLVTCLGGLIVCGLLSSTEFLLQIDRFRGIKLLMLIPPLLTVLYYIMKESRSPMNISEILKLPVYAWHLVMLIVLGAGVTYYILRTGNTSPSAASSLELTLRLFLDKILIVRPRFKEFLMAYPALMLSASLLKLGIEPWVWCILLVAAIGQADILDTLAHLHTPLLVSLLRILNGLILGWVIGIIVLTLFWNLFIKKGK